MLVTGVTISRLSELRKYAITEVFTEQYVGNGGYGNNGVDYINSIENQMIIYYIDEIKYIDYITTATTTFEFTSQGTSSPDFIDVPYFKDFQKENIISTPKINSDVFIVRQELSAFDKNFRLEYIKNLVDLETYAGGNYFYIKTN